MPVKKIHTAFISSAFRSLRDERKIVINSLLNHRILPIGMENFTVSTSGEFSDIERLIDDSDFFIVLLGAAYGSTDASGLSWTEREYDYALSKGKTIVAILCDELVPLLNQPRDTLNEDQQKQVAFATKIPYARSVSEDIDIRQIISQFFGHTDNYSRCIGWIRPTETVLSATELAAWQEEHKLLHLSGTWYHVHLSDSDRNYIRIGTVSIQQDFSPGHYQALLMTGKNNGVLCYDNEEKALYPDMMKTSQFKGEYTLKDNGTIFGIFHVSRSFDEDFASLTVLQGTRRGIHDFTIDLSKESTEMIEGMFHDEAPSPKCGRIFLFRTATARDKFVMRNRRDIIPVE